MAMPPLNKDAPYFVAMNAFERNLLRDALIANDWNIEAAGRTLGITGSHVRTRVKAIGGFDEDPKRGKNAGRENSNSPTEGPSGSDARPADIVDGETDPDDAEQAGDRDETSEPVASSSDEPN